MSASDTRQTIMDVAQAAVQERGYNALSFREVAKEIGIKSASIHYHFPTKSDLAAALAKRYTDTGVLYLNDLLVQSQDQRTLIQGYTGIFRAALQNENRMCLCGMLAAEFHDLAEEVRAEVENFAAANVRWLMTVLAISGSGEDQQTLEKKALAIYSAVQGAQLVARGRDDIGLFDQTLDMYRAAGLLP